MNENAKKWVAALRSGKYQQVKGALRRSEGYCCLGVACDVYRKETRKGRWLKGNHGNFIFMRTSQVLPLAIQEWLGLTDELGYVDEDRALTELNDNGSTFAEIADLIESEPEGLFVPTTDTEGGAEQ